MADLSVMSFLNEETQQETEYNIKDSQARSDIGTINGKIPSGASSSNKMATASDITAINNKIPSAASSTNKLVDTTAMNDAIGQAVSAAYKPAGNKTVAELTSSLLVAANRGKVYNMTDAGTTTADFVEGAGNPIRVGDDVGICEPTTGTFKFNILSGFIAVDTNPTQSSANPVSSGGVYSELAGMKNGQNIDSFGDVETALAGKVDKVTGKGLSTNDYDNTAKGIVDNIQSNVIANTKLIKDSLGWSGKNKLPIKYASSPNTNNGITWTVNSDHTVSASGTSTGVSTFTILEDFGYVPNKYIGKKITGCPSGGSYNGYRILVNYSNDGTTWVKSGDDIGNGYVIENYPYINIALYIPAGQSFSPAKTFKPMIYDADTLDPTYEPSFGSTAIAWADAGKYVGKNLLINNYISHTEAGVTFTVNKDGSISLSGTSTADIGFGVIINDVNYLPEGNYILSGCPSGGSANTYRLIIANEAVTSFVTDLGDGANFGIVGENVWHKCYIRINSGVNCNGLVFKPMIRKATILDNTYEPYIPDNTELMTWEANGKLGAKNILDHYAITQTLNGITFTVNSDRSITANGTATDDTYNFIGRDDFYDYIPAGTYIASGSPDLPNVTSDTFGLFLTGRNLNGWHNAFANGNMYAITDKNDTTNGKLRFFIFVKKNQVLDNVVFKPMLRLAEDTNNTYAPYAMTNKELTKNKVDKLVKVLSSSDNLNDITETGFYVATTTPTNAPENASYFSMLVLNGGSSGGVIRQIIFNASGSSTSILVRTYSGNTWKNWVKFTGTELT